ncbi:hypothetical protein ACLOJK_001465 [Asimina triloba]
MKQSLVKAINSSTHIIFNPPLQPPRSLQNHHPPAPKSTLSIPKQACKISRRDLTIRAPSSSILSILLGACCDVVVVFDPFPARADEVPSDSGDNADSEARVDGSQTDISNGGQEEDATSTAADGANGGIEENPSAGREVGLEEGSVQSLHTADGGERENSNADECGEKTPTRQAFLDISIDGEPAGRIVIGLYGENAPAGAARFSGLVSGAAGISYRRKEFVKIVPNYIQHGGVRSYGVDAELAARRAGNNLAVDSLVGEWEKASEKCPGTKNAAGTVGIIVRDPLKPPPKPKLVARKGKLEIDEEEVGKDPNGTEFVITTKDSPELDSSTLVIGRVVQGMDVVEKISKVKTVQENTGSPYFRSDTQLTDIIHAFRAIIIIIFIEIGRILVAKLIGDKRAVVAERGFNRPYSKVIVTNCGLMK